MAALHYCAIGCDIANAFAEAPGPEKIFYMKIDEAFQDWWVNHKGREPLDTKWVIPVLKNLQGHPEAPRLWNRYVHHTILEDKMGFKSCTHEPNLYYRWRHDKVQLLLRQVDDFIIATADMDAAYQIREELQSHMTEPMNDLGVVKRFNGVDILQSRHFVRLSCETYIDKVIGNHDWQDLQSATLPVPMRSDSDFLSKFDQESGPTDPEEAKRLQETMGFSYRQAVGELIYAMTVCRLDVCSAACKLAQHTQAPAKIHYQAVKATWAYLKATRSDGITYWRSSPNPTLPEAPFPNIPAPPP